ncbi:flavin-dependent thymidylate synthase [Clostridia bacterium]|nr:flavin-dependent thymidylate synthase [Clostridia bacterium]
MRVTPTVELLKHTEDPERAIALAAKLCYSKSDLDDLRSDVDASDVGRFISMLYSLGHLSAFEHASFTFGIEGVSRALLAQITRHRIASFSVQSQRYVDIGAEFNYIMPPAIAELDEEQKSGGALQKEYDRQMKQMHEWYREWQSRLNPGEKGNEDARFVLPNAAETKMIVTMNARELLHFFELRCCNRAQWEIREVAWRMLELASRAAPAVFAKAGPSCISGVCSEGKMSCGKAAEVKARRNASQNGK